MSFDRELEEVLRGMGKEDMTVGCTENQWIGITVIQQCIINRKHLHMRKQKKNHDDSHCEAVAEAAKSIESCAGKQNSGDIGSTPPRAEHTEHNTVRASGVNGSGQANLREEQGPQGSQSQVLPTHATQDKMV